VGRAKIVGETSVGAAHITDTIDIGHGIMMVLPVNRLAHVKTNTDWEGTGVVPDISVKADDALAKAKEIIQEAKRDNK
jgi:C-terminal processing protease CtpA/Prc